MSTRRRQELRQRMRARLTFAALIMILAALAASPGARLTAAGLAKDALSRAKAVFASRETQRRTLTLPAMHVYALQLGVYDNGERAQQEQLRIAREGMPCIVWQRERMRIVCAAALTESGLQKAQPAGMETYVIEDELPEVRLRVTGTGEELEEACALLALPDALFEALCGGERTLDELLTRARGNAQKALGAHRGNALYTQLAQSVVNWCQLVDGARESMGDALAQQYAALTMCTLCRELRAELAML